MEFHYDRYVSNLADLSVIGKLRYSFRLEDSTNGKFKDSFIHIGEIVFGKTDYQMSQSISVGDIAA